MPRSDGYTRQASSGELIVRTKGAQKEPWLNPGQKKNFFLFHWGCLTVGALHGLSRATKEKNKTKIKSDKPVICYMVLAGKKLENTVTAGQ